MRVTDLLGGLCERRRVDLNQGAEVFLMVRLRRVAAAPPFSHSVASLPAPFPLTRLVSALSALDLTSKTR